MDKLQHDIKIQIASGAGRVSKVWKNKELLWSEFVAAIKTTTRTAETIKEYMAMTRDDQLRTKDVGAFVGGYLKNGRRIKQNLVCRSIITLDADNCDEGVYSLLDIVLGDHAYAVYSTHKHTKTKPRLRVVIPLTTAIDGEQYRAVGLKLADAVGMDYWDGTGFEPERLMFWPSTAKDGIFYFDCTDAPILNPKKILDQYIDWRDSSLWPTPTGADQQRLRAIKKQGDPLAKPGIIGAFCRSYSIDAAIDKFLPEVYTDCSIEGRYTYAEGTTSAGLIVYDDKFAYSHHGTDPISGKLVNAYDLVRLHLFGDRDEDAAPDTTVTKLPSTAAMTDFVVADGVATKLLDHERIESVRKDFSDNEILLPDDEVWLEDLDRDKNTGKISATPKNVMAILENDPNLKNKLGTDLFAHRVMIKGALPWQKSKQLRAWSDADDAGLRNYLATVYQVVNRGIIGDALIEVFDRHGYHPVKEYLDALHWDGVPRVDTLYIDYLGAQDTAYTRAVSRKHLVAAVARIMRPGVKFDNALIMIGRQGVGKTTLLTALGGKWYTNSITNLSSKDAVEQLQGSWIIDLDEMQATRKTENENIKSFISRQSDKFRLPFGRRTEEYPRQCVFMGSTNDMLFLRDRTGNRRFWPVTVGMNEPTKSVINDLHAGDVAQIWAEAKVLYEGGETLVLTRELETMARDIQETHMEGQEKAGLIEDFLSKKLPEDWDNYNLYERRTYLENPEEIKEKGTMGRTQVCALEIWCELFGGTQGNLNNAMARELNGILQSLRTWEPYAIRAKSKGRGRLRFSLYGLQTAYIKVIQKWA